MAAKQFPVSEDPNAVAPTRRCPVPERTLVHVPPGDEMDNELPGTATVPAKKVLSLALGSSALSVDPSYATLIRLNADQVSGGAG